MVAPALPSPAPNPVPNHEEVLKRAAYLRASGKNWSTVAQSLNMAPEELDELIFVHEQLYFEYQRRASIRYSTEHQLIAGFEECKQLRHDNARIAQRAADLLGRFQGECAWIDLQFRKLENAEKEKEVRKLEAEARIAEADAEIKRDKRPKAAICADEWPNDHREWFPITPEGWLALAIYEYVLFSTPAELAADRETDFREQCLNRQIQLPDAEPLPYWMRPEYGDAARTAVGWAPGGSKRFAHDILAVNKVPAVANLTDVVRKLDQVLKLGTPSDLMKRLFPPEPGSDDEQSRRRPTTPPVRPSPATRSRRQDQKAGVRNRRQGTRSRR